MKTLDAMNNTKAQGLLSLIRKGKLRHNYKNTENVLWAYAECKLFDNVLKSTGLDFLPDPNNEHSGELSDLENWMVEALQRHDKAQGFQVRTEATCRKILAEAVDALGKTNAIKRPAQ